MGKKICGILCFLLLGIVLVTSAALDPKEISEDWLIMDGLLTQRATYLFQSEFEKNPDGFVDKWLPFLDSFRKKATEFTDRYGADRDSLRAVFEGIEKPEGAKREYYELVNEFLGADIEDLHMTIVNWAESMGRDQFGKWERLADPDPKQIELKHRYAKKALEGYRVAARLQPDTDYSEFIDKCETAEKETKEQFLKTLETLKWPGNNPEFDGPGKPKELSAAALEFLQEHPKWSKPEYDDEHVPYAACISGRGWDVYKRNSLTEEPTQYSVDILVAFAGKNDPDIVYVYSMVFYTAEEAGVKKALPFKYANSKQYQKYQMLKDAVPKGVSSKKGDRSAAGAAGKKAEKNSSRSDLDDDLARESSFGMWRVIFSLLLVLGGSVGAKAFISEKVPDLKAFLDTMYGFSLPLGLLLIVFGLFGFLGNLFSFAPLASLFPQAMAVVMGLIFVKKTPGIIPVAYAKKLKVLEPLEMPLGLATAGLGLLHLVIGGLPLM